MKSSLSSTCILLLSILYDKLTSIVSIFIFNSSISIITQYNAEKQGFEPYTFQYNQISNLLLFPTACLLLKLIEEEVGFEPTDPFRPPVFKTGAINHSAILPLL